MSHKKYRSRKNKPIFSEKKQGNSFIGIFLMLFLLGVMVFIGYSVGKPIVEFLDGREAAEDDKDVSATLPTEQTEPKTDKSTEPTERPPEVTTAPEQEDEKPEAVKKGTLFVSYQDDNSGSYEEYVLSQISYAKDNGYSGICIELIADGGMILFNTADELAAAAEAIAPNCITNLGGIVAAADEAGIKPYARISALSDHLVSWYDKTVSYMIEGSISRWLDNGISSGGKPWLSPFEQGSKDYIGSICREISAAGFAGLVAGEMEFPDFRQRDLDYIGNIVKTPNRYKALTDFAESVYNSFGSAKEYSIEVDIQDIISNKAEILSHPSELCTKNIYIRFDPADIPARIKRADGSEISLEGLDNVNILKVLLRHVGESLDGSGLMVTPIISGCELDERIMAVLEEVGFEASKIAVSEGKPVKQFNFNEAL